MGFQKFTQTESTEVVSPEGHRAIEEAVGGSLADADEGTRQRVAKILEDEAAAE